LWLPALWGFTAREYQDWLRLCSNAARCAENGWHRQLAEFEHDLRGRPWTWLRSSLDHYLGAAVSDELAFLSQLRARQHDIPELVDRALSLLYWGVSDAVEEHNRGTQNARLLLGLYPLTAIHRAVQLAVTEI
jgi:hypothetical protein